MPLNEPPCMSTSDHSLDPLGHRLLRQRLDQIPGELAGMMVRGLPQLRGRTVASDRFLVTGTGSSEAHARYLCNLINLYTDRTASYLPLSAFLNLPRELSFDKTLVVFSQGVSPNAQIALRRFRDFRHAILFTSTTPTAARQSGKPDRADLITDLAEWGGDIVYFPLAEEYTTLIRLVGPLCGYLSCLQFLAHLSNSQVAAPRPGEILPLMDLVPPTGLEEAMLSQGELFRSGFNLITAAPICDFAQNLACKFMEGLFWPCPPISDFLQFAHGPFQQATADKRPILILQGDSPAEADLVKRSQAMLGSVGLPSWVIHVQARPIHSIFGFEMIFNKLIVNLLEKKGIDQVNWPGKGRDDLLYGFCQDQDLLNKP